MKQAHPAPHVYVMDKNRKSSFYPYYFFEIIVVALLTIEAVLILAALFPPRAGREIDFSAQYSPRPEWYFLFLYQLTKYFPGRWTFVGAVLLPGLAFSLLLLTPFFDGGKETGLRHRKTAAIAGIGLLAAVIFLTVVSFI